MKKSILALALCSCLVSSSFANAAVPKAGYSNISGNPFVCKFSNTANGIVYRMNTKKINSATVTMKILEGNVVGTGARIGMVAARFNEFIVSKLVSGAEDALVRHGVDSDSITLAWVPGAYEIPVIAKKMAESGRYDAVICLGAVIKGSTSHYDLVCNEVSKGIAAVSLETGVPVLFGVITTDNIEQAIERAGTKAGNKGYDVACSAIEMINLIKGGLK